MAKILIIKLGYSETLDKEISRVTSLGDVLRTTVVLHLFKKDIVTWLVDEEAYPLLKDNKYISTIFIYNSNSLSKIQKQSYDVVINFEKNPDICMFSDSIKTNKHYGFRFDKDTHNMGYYKGSETAFNICNNIDIKRNNKKSWQQIIMEMCGGYWDKEDYVLGYKPKSKQKYDIGLNWAVGVKWPNKFWPKKYWVKLAELLEGSYNYSWQRGLDNVNDYIEWINSCRLIITADSLAQHIAIALGKKILVLYGPTNYFETYLYDRGNVLLPSVNYKCMPCVKNRCIQKKSCMNFIEPEKVIEEIQNVLEKTAIKL